MPVSPPLKSRSTSATALPLPVKDWINAFRGALSSMRIENVSQLSTLIGTLYDKQALSDNKPTSIVELKLEDFFDEPNE